MPASLGSEAQLDACPGDGARTSVGVDAGAGIGADVGAGAGAGAGTGANVGEVAEGD